MKLSLQIKLGQQLTMTPQLQQAIKLLQLSTLDLQQEIQEALETNPMLEVEEDFELPDDRGPSSSSEDSTASSASSPTLDGEGDYGDGGDSSTFDSDDFQEAGEFSADESWNEKDIPDELSVDSNWDDIYIDASNTLSGSQ